MIGDALECRFSFDSVPPLPLFDGSLLFMTLLGPGSEGALSVLGGDSPPPLPISKGKHRRIIKDVVCGMESTVMGSTSKKIEVG